MTSSVQRTGSKRISSRALLTRDSRDAACHAPERQYTLPYGLVQRRSGEGARENRPGSKLSPPIGSRRFWGWRARSSCSESIPCWRPGCRRFWQGSAQRLYCLVPLGACSRLLSGGFPEPDRRNNGLALGVPDIRTRRAADHRGLRQPRRPPPRMPGGFKSRWRRFERREQRLACRMAASYRSNVGRESRSG